MISDNPRLPQIGGQEIVHLQEGEVVAVAFWRRFQERFYALWRELATEIRNLLTAEHPAVRIPDVTIDAGSGERGITNGTVFDNLGFGAQVANTSSTTYGTAVSYSGVGVLSCVVLTDAKAAGAVSAKVRITIDGNQVFEDTDFLPSNSVARAAVGYLGVWDTGGSAIAFSDPVGLPFKSSCLVEFASTAADRVDIGWRIAKKH